MDASGIALGLFFVSVFVVFGVALGWASWDEVPNGTAEGTVVTAFTEHPNFRHVVAVIAGIAVGLLVLFYTGDSDILNALGSGFGALCLVYLGGYLPARRPHPPSKTRSF